MCVTHCLVIPVHSWVLLMFRVLQHTGAYATLMGKEDGAYNSGAYTVPLLTLPTSGVITPIRAAPLLNGSAFYAPFIAYNCPNDTLTILCV